MEKVLSICSQKIALLLIAIDTMFVSAEAKSLL